MASLSVHQLNADSTFLLTWFPTPAAPSDNPTTTARKVPGSFTVLIDPWLSGHSTIFHPKFALAGHTTQSVVGSLDDLKDQVDLIIISQGMDDHCHKETLCSLPADTTIPIVAAPKAAKMISSWKYFTNDVVRSLSSYSPSKSDTTFRIPITTSCPSSNPGELTVTNICPKVDLTGLHNAIGITYTPPASSPIPASTLSALYTPHGTPLTSLQPYISHHLRPLPGALPLTALFHSLNHESNPWILGGEICAGTPGALQIVRQVGVRNWIGAHDEIKEVSGLGTKFLRSRVFAEDDARELVEKEGCEVTILGCGGVGRFE
jgi:hypothetical protein